jgi:hypothetical protein
LGFLLLRVSKFCLESSFGPSTVEDDQHHCYVSRDHNNFSELRHAIGSDANCCHSFDSGSDAAFLSKNLDQSNSEKDYHTVFELPSTDDCETLVSIENILTSIEDMFKPSLLDLANSHGVDSKMYQIIYVKPVVSLQRTKDVCR